MLMSLLGHYNNFFFAAHLLDIAMGVKTLRTILSSVTHNGKQVWTAPRYYHQPPCHINWPLDLFPCVSQLLMTVGLLAVVVYLYTVVAFNFFRKFYNKSEDEDEPDMKCDDMMTVRDDSHVLWTDWSPIIQSWHLRVCSCSVTCSTCTSVYALAVVLETKSRTQLEMNTSCTEWSSTSPSSSLSLSSCWLSSRVQTDLSVFSFFFLKFWKEKACRFYAHCRVHTVI